MTTLLSSSGSPAVEPIARLAEHGLPAEAVRAEIAALRAGDHDYRDGTVFNSICSSPVPLAAEVFTAALEVNRGDDRLFPSARQAEAAVGRMLGDLFDLPDACGVATSGGTEANLLAVQAAVLRWRRRHGDRGRPPVVLGAGAHFSFEKICRLLAVEPVVARLGPGYRVDPADVLRKIRPDTALVVLTAGTSETGAVDEIEAVAARAAELGVPVHVDAATGGFLIPFARRLGHDLPYCGFAVPGVTSLTVDPHKYGGAPIPAGYLLFRHAEDRDALRTASHYRGTADHFGLLGTRPGAGMLAAYAALRHLGRAGYTAQAAELFALRDEFLARLADAGIAPAYRPDLTVVGFRDPDPEGLLAALAERGLIVSLARRLGLIRVVVHRHQRAGQLARLADTVAALRGRRKG